MKDPCCLSKFAKLWFTLIFQETGKYNCTIIIVPKTIEKYKSFAIKQPKKKGVKSGLPLTFKDFLNNLLSI